MLKTEYIDLTSVKQLALFIYQTLVYLLKCKTKIINMTRYGGICPQY